MIFRFYYLGCYFFVLVLSFCKALNWLFSHVAVTLLVQNEKSPISKVVGKN